MLRMAIWVAVGAIAVALITPDLVSAVMPDSAQTAPQAHPAPVRADAVQPAAASASGETSIAADPRGQYAADVEINGQNVQMLVDTGATMVVLSYDTAARLGLQVLSSDFTARAQTANGVAALAPVTLRDVTVGSVSLSDVKALVAERSAGPVNLLGESFLRRLASVEQRSGRLVLRQ